MVLLLPDAHLLQIGLFVPIEILFNHRTVLPNTESGHRNFKGFACWREKTLKSSVSNVARLFATVWSLMPEDDADECTVLLSVPAAALPPVLFPQPVKHNSVAASSAAVTRVVSVFPFFMMRSFTMKNQIIDLQLRFIWPVWFCRNARKWLALNCGRLFRLLLLPSQPYRIIGCTNQCGSHHDYIFQNQSSGPG